MLVKKLQVSLIIIFKKDRFIWNKLKNVELVPFSERANFKFPAKVHLTIAIRVGLMKY